MSASASGLPPLSASIDGPQSPVEFSLGETRRGEVLIQPSTNAGRPERSQSVQSRRDSLCVRAVDALVSVERTKRLQVAEEFVRALGQGVLEIQDALQGNKAVRSRHRRADSERDCGVRCALHPAAQHGKSGRRFLVSESKTNAKLMTSIYIYTYVWIYLVSFFHFSVSLMNHMNGRILLAIKVVNRDHIHCDGFKSVCIHLIGDAHIGGDG